MAGTTFLNDGSLIVSATFAPINLRPIFSLTKLDDAGEVDIQFGTNGRTTGSFLPEMPAHSGPVIVSSDKKRLIMAGATFTQGANDPLPAILCLDSAGNRDTSFGPNKDGQVIVYSAAEESYPLGISPFVCSLPDGSIIIGVNYITGPLKTPTATLLKFNENGTPATDFGTDGRVEIKLAEADTATSLSGCCILDNGRILISGYAQANGAPKKGLLAMLNANGSPNLPFGSGVNTRGYLLVARDPVHAEFNVVKQRAANKFMAAGYSDPYDIFSRRGMLMGFDDKGDFDPEFNSGKLFIRQRSNSPMHINWQDILFVDGQILAAGASSEGGYIGCLHMGGYYDTGFARGGFLDEGGMSGPTKLAFHEWKDTRTGKLIRTSPGAFFSALYRYHISYPEP